MPIYLCRWPNGDVSLAAGESEVEVADVLDEVDNPDAAELMRWATRLPSTSSSARGPMKKERCLCVSKI
jgi:hypothetical protein